MSESKVKFKVWFDDGAITPMWVVNAVCEEDCEHPFTGAVNTDASEEDISNIGLQLGINAEEIEFI